MRKTAKALSFTEDFGLVLRSDLRTAKREVKRIERREAHTINEHDEVALHKAEAKRSRRRERNGSH